MIDFVGAGPGAPDLITVRGRDLLEQADVIIYAGSLVNPELLQYARPDAEIFNSAHMTLEEVIDVMEKAEAAGRRTVRLHTGDQSLYGAVREQMELLDAKGIRYRSCPGVSACFGAAASLDLEYTVPGISQTLIITRMAGRTPVPDGERIEALASHGSSMAVYLSAGMLAELSKRLIDGGYSAETPAALVYKATWSEEKCVACTVGSLAQAGEASGIDRTAVVLIGEALRPKDPERSKLYDPGFSTGYREATPVKILRKMAICYTKQGEELLVRLNEEAAAAGIEPVKIYSGRTDPGGEADHNRPDVIRYSGTPSDWIRMVRDTGGCAVFVGAVGIAVRAVSRIASDKLTDIPVVAVDDGGQFVIPLLSGHAGGANKLAMTLAALLQAVPVITTSTDVNDMFSVDVYAAEKRLTVRNRDGIKKVSAKALEGKAVTLSIRNYPPNEPVDVIVADETDREYSLLLSPKPYVVGIGLKRNRDTQDTEKFLLENLQRRGIDPEEIYALCSLDVKEKEPAIRAFSVKYRIPFITFDVKLLEQAQGDFAHSDFVEKTVGIDNVCERAAALCAGYGSEKVLGKTKGDGITMAVYRRKGV